MVCAKKDIFYMGGRILNLGNCLCNMYISFWDYFFFLDPDDHPPCGFGAYKIPPFMRIRIHFTVARHPS